MEGDPMNRSEKLDVWAANMFAVQRDVKQPTRNATGQARGRTDYRYADLGELWDVLRPVLTANSMFATQNPLTVDGGTEIRTTVWTNAGKDATGPQWVEFGPLFMPHAADAQATGSAITYGCRYQLRAIFGLAGEDDDGASAASSPAHRDNDPTQEPASTGASGRGGAAEDVAGDQPEARKLHGEVATSPAPATHTQVLETWKEATSSQDAHPGIEHKLKPSPNVPGARYCIITGPTGLKCDYVEGMP
jgi:hypothetical protein